jgi:hypothetical protein
MPSNLTTVEVVELRTTEAYSGLDRANVKYNTYERSREENLTVREKTRPKMIYALRKNESNVMVKMHLQ